MIIVLKSGASDGEIADVERRITAMGYRPHTIRGQLRTVIGAIGDDRGKERLRSLESLETVESVTPILQPFKLASREVRSANSIVRVGGVVIGGSKVVVMAGPCSVESREQVLEVAARVKAAGATVLRGGAFKPRTSPYAFQGLEEEGLKLLAEARRETGLPIITEVMEPDKIDVVAEHADILQIGARDVQNFSLLRKVGAAGKPVLLKRGMSTSIQEWLLSAEYVLSGGNPNVILCERGIRTFETTTRFTLDLNAVPVLKKLTHLPVVVDPSHGTGHWEYVESMAMAAVAAGADGLLIEVHPRPEEALSDGPQSLKPGGFAASRARRRARGSASRAVVAGGAIHRRARAQGRGETRAPARARAPAGAHAAGRARASPREHAAAAGARRRGARAGAAQARRRAARRARARRAGAAAAGGTPGRVTAPAVGTRSAGRAEHPDRAAPRPGRGRRLGPRPRRYRGRADPSRLDEGRVQRLSRSNTSAHQGPLGLSVREESGHTRLRGAYNLARRGFRHPQRRTPSVRGDRAAGAV